MGLTTGLMQFPMILINIQLSATINRWNLKENNHPVFTVSTSHSFFTITRCDRRLIRKLTAVMSSSQELMQAHQSYNGAATAFLAT